MDAVYSEKKFYALIIGACVASVLLGLAFGYLFFSRSMTYTIDAAEMPATVYHAAVGVPDPARAETLPAASAAVVVADEAPSHRYVVKIVDGYIAVFYADHAGGGLKELTTVPANPLPEADLTELAAGIYIYTEEALARILQDYGS